MSKHRGFDGKVPEHATMLAVYKYGIGQKTRKLEDGTEQTYSAERPQRCSLVNQETQATQSRIPIQALEDVPQFMAFIRDAWGPGKYKLRWLAEDGANLGWSPVFTVMAAETQAGVAHVPTQGARAGGASMPPPAVAMGIPPIPGIPPEMMAFLTWQEATRRQAQEDARAEARAQAEQARLQSQQTLEMFKVMMMSLQQATHGNPAPATNLDDKLKIMRLELERDLARALDADESDDEDEEEEDEEEEPILRTLEKEFKSTVRSLVKDPDSKARVVGFLQHLPDILRAQAAQNGSAPRTTPPQAGGESG